ncbi:MAG: hypothetical protein ISQ08_00260 [Planctomycetes bacterium]|nr:hypothetical protein [Planctomycetota bacterium]
MTQLLRRAPVLLSPGRVAMGILAASLLGCGGDATEPPAPSVTLPRSGRVFVQGTEIDTADWIDERGERSAIGSVVATRRSLEGETSTEVYQLTTEGQVRQALRLSGVDTALTDAIAHRGSRAAVAGRSWLWGEVQQLSGGWARGLAAGFELRELTPLHGGPGGYAALVEGPDGRLVHLRADAAGELLSGATIVLEGGLPLGLINRAVLVPAVDPAGHDQALVASGATAGVPTAQLVDPVGGALGALTWTGLDPVLEVLPRDLAQEQADGARWLGWSLQDGAGSRTGTLLAAVGVGASSRPVEARSVVLGGDLGATDLRVTDLLPAGSLDPDLEGLLLVAGTLLEGAVRSGFAALVDLDGALVWSTRLEGPLGGIQRVRLGRVPEPRTGAALALSWTGQGASALDTWVAQVVAATGDAADPTVFGFEGGLPVQPPFGLEVQNGDPLAGPVTWSWLLETAEQEQVVLSESLVLQGAWGEFLPGKPMRLSWPHRASRLMLGLTLADPVASSFGAAGPPGHATCLYASATLAPASGLGTMTPGAPLATSVPAVPSLEVVTDPTLELDLGWDLLTPPAFLAGSVPNACDG